MRASLESLLANFSESPFLPQPIILMARQEQSSNINFIKRQFRNYQRGWIVKFNLAPSLLISFQNRCFWTWIDCDMWKKVRLVKRLQKVAMLSWIELREICWDAWVAVGCIGAVLVRGFIQLRLSELLNLIFKYILLHWSNPRILHHIKILLTHPISVKPFKIYIQNFV